MASTSFDSFLSCRCHAEVTVDSNTVTRISHAINLTLGTWVIISPDDFCTGS